MRKARKGMLAAVALGLVASLMQAAPATADSLEYVGVAPIRVADTRSGIGGVPAGKVAAGTTLRLPIAGLHSVAADAEAVSLNVTVTQPASPGYVTVHPCGITRPLASNVNYVAGQTVPNAVVVKIGAAGEVCLYTTASTHLVVDLNGYFPTTTEFEAIDPVRAADTRDGTGVPSGALPAGQTLAVPVGEVDGGARDGGSAVANVTVTRPASGGYVTAWRCGDPQPATSNLNFTARQTVANAVIVPMSDAGSICLYSTATTHLVVDVGGFLPGGFVFEAGYLPVGPEREFDTRVDGDRSKLAAGEEIVMEYGGVAAVLNVTVTQPNGSGYITVYPCGEGRPMASNLNFVRGQTVANLVIAPVDGDGEVCVYTSSTTHILADVQGLFPSLVQR